MMNFALGCDSSVTLFDGRGLLSVKRLYDVPLHLYPS